MADHIDPEAVARVAATLTWEPPDPGEWEFDAAHQSRPLTATGQMIVPTFAEGFRTAFASFGMPISHMEMRCVNGYGYMSAFVHGAPRKGNGKPPPGLLIKLLTRVPPSARKRIGVAREALATDHGMAEVERWDELRPDWVARCVELQDVDVVGCTDADLADHVERTGEHLETGFRLHFELLSQAIPVGEFLVSIEEWGVDRAAAAKATFHGVRTTQEARGRLDEIAHALGDAEVADLDAIRRHSAGAAAALDEYLRFHGTWLLADDVDNPTLAENPSVVFSTIERHRAGAGDESDEIDAATAACRDRVGPERVAAFDTAMMRAQRAYAALDDNSGLLCAWPGGLVRRAQVEAAQRLVASGRLAAAEDVWTLVPGEIAGLLRGAAAPTLDEVRDRSILREAQASVDPPAHLGSPPSPPPDAGLFPEPVGHFVRAFMAFMDAKFGEPDAPPTGIGQRQGTGRAVVALTAADALERIEPGDVLVTRYTTPAYNVIMPILGGVVITTGGANSHTAVVARELGIPAVLAVQDALERIPDGSIVTVDPVAATVVVHDD